jgi:type II secretory pathway pseudopilin PulG
MPRLVIPSERLAIPQEAAGFNRSSQWSRGLRALLTPFGEAVTSTHASPASGATALASSPFGMAWRFNGSGAVEVPRVPYVPPPLTLLVVARKANVPNESLVSFGGAGPGAGWKFCDSSIPADAAVTYGGVAQYTFPEGGYFLIGQWAVYVITLSASEGRVYRNGALYSTVSVGTPGTPSRPLTIGASHNGGFVDFAQSDVAVVGLWNYVMSADQVRALSGSLPQLWEPETSIGPFVGTAGAASAITLTGPSSGSVGSPSSNFTVGANGTITGTITVTPNDGGDGGTFSPTSVAISAGTPTATFTYTAANAGSPTATINVTNSGGLSNPAGIAYSATVPPATQIVVTVPDAAGLTGFSGFVLSAAAPGAGVSILRNFTGVSFNGSGQATLDISGLSVAQGVYRWVSLSNSTGDPAQSPAPVQAQGPALTS